MHHKPARSLLTAAPLALLLAGITPAQNQLLRSDARA
jgi:hypothetical protein